MLQWNRVIRHKTSILLAVALLAAPRLVTADALTGQAQDDPKDLWPAPPAAPLPHPSLADGFVPMPSWARNIVMPPLPAALMPMGRKPASAVASTTPPPLAPPKETPVASSTSAAPEAPKPKPAPAPEPPALVAVSPFLQWVQANPQAAAAQARQQANAYHAGPLPGSNVPTGPDSNGEAPYWLPPLIDSGGVSTSPTAVGGSAAIYSTPQR